MRKIVIVVGLIVCFTRPAYAVDTLKEFFNESFKEVGAIFAEKGDGRKSLRETTAEAWKTIWS